MTLLRALLSVSLIIVAARTGFATCGDDPGDPAAVAAAQAAVETACPCTAASSHSAYIGCARDVLETRPDLSPACRQALGRCAARSVCGRSGAVTCCRTRAPGDTRCTIKRDPSRCTAPAGGSACVGVRSSCCDACTAGGCAPPTTTTTVPPCVTSAYPICGDQCGPGEICSDNPFTSACECFPDGSQPCGDSRHPVCNGTCPTGEHCGALSLFGACGCVPDGTTACGETMSCGGGSCPPGDECSPVTFPTITFCSCAPAGVPCCAGGLSCGPGQTCGMAPGLCLCGP